MKLTPLITGCVVICAVASACAKPIDCHDEEIQAYVVLKIDKSMADTTWYPKVREHMSVPKLLNIQTLKKIEEINQISCRAIFSFDYNSRAQAVPIEFSLSLLEESKRLLMRMDAMPLRRKLQGLLSQDRSIQQ